IATGRSIVAQAPVPRANPWRSTSASPSTAPRSATATSAGQHVQPDGGAPGPGSLLAQVTQLVWDAQSVAAVIVGRVGVASGQRVFDPAVVPDLAHQGQAVSPDPQDSRAAGVDHGVGRDLVDRDHQVLRSAGADPFLDGAAADLVPQRLEILLAEGRRPRPRGRAGQRLAADGPGYGGAAVVRARRPSTPRTANDTAWPASPRAPRTRSSLRPGTATSTGSPALTPWRTNEHTSLAYSSRPW